jgi:preprotein translocase subunit YajC
MNSILMFLDQAATTGDAGAGTSGSLLATLIPFALVIVVFYFFLIRPQKKQEKEAAKMRDSLQVGDEVTTIGGVIGRVVSIKDETFTLETSRDRTKIRFLRSAIKSVDVKVADLRAAEAAEEKPAEAVEEKPAKKS